MTKLDLRIALRTFLKGKWYNLLNIAGLVLGLAAFIFVTLYVDNETSYDTWNKKADRIFLVEREMPNGPSPYTPGLFAAAIKSQCPEVEETGRTNTALFQIPFYTASGRFLIKQWMGADYAIANMLGIRPKGFNLNPKSTAPTILLSKATASVLFPGHDAVRNKTVTMISRAGMPMAVAGVAEEVPGNTHISFDCIGFATDITQGKDQSYATQIYQTYVLVRPGTAISRLSKKIDQIYRTSARADTSQVAREALNRPGPTIFLDPLKNLHLKPHYASQVDNQIVNGLIALSVIILVVSGINFANLYIGQANKRSKEVGIKKVNGIIKRQIAFQFLLEIFLQCLVALTLSFLFVVIGLPYFNELLGVNLLMSGINLRIIAQICVTLLSLTLLAGLYPALVMAGFKPADVLRGDQLTSVGKRSWVRHSITLLQFTFAIVFMITLLVINQQVKFMKTNNPGFEAKQVVYIDNLGIYNDPKKFEPVRNRIKAIAGVKSVTVAANIPGGIVPASHDYTVQGKPISLSTTSVDYDYFETLQIKFKEGHAFSSPVPGDSANAVLNEAAVKMMALKNPIGVAINGCSGKYKVIGVIKDVKANGFEGNVQPSIYVMSDRCGSLKTQIMISAEQKSLSSVLATLKEQWSDINKLDGDNFNYHFLDELYGRLFKKQEQLQTVLTWFSVLAVFIAALGFFASAAHTIRLRTKEIAIRKVFGAKSDQLMVLISKPFFYTILLANLLAWPFAFFISTKWLQSFAYRVHISTMPFVFSLSVSLAIVAITVCFQIIRAVRFNPAIKLKV